MQTGIATPMAGAAGAETPFEAAIKYAQLGYSVLPLIGKKPSLLNWKIYQWHAADCFDIARWAEAGLLRNVGIISGRVSDNLIVVDLDGDEAGRLFAANFPDLLDTYTVSTGSGHGAHVYLHCETLPPTTRLLHDHWNIELRANGCYVVAPPSVHPDTGYPYFVANRAPVRTLPDVDRLVAWLRGERDKRSAAPMTTPATAPVQVSRWAAAALAAETAAVRAAPGPVGRLPGSRNNTLNRAAFKLGQLVGAGLLNRTLVEQELLDAAAALALAEGELSVLKTIRSGLEAGLANPRKVRA